LEAGADIEAKDKVIILRMDIGEHMTRGNIDSSSCSRTRDIFTLLMIGCLATASMSSVWPATFTLRGEERPHPSRCTAAREGGISSAGRKGTSTVGLRAVLVSTVASMIGSISCQAI
jgi:hypothetical protein